jgi:serine/threonine protein kinase/WD40 repeat protein
MIADRLEELFGEVIELAPSDRALFLERSCGADTELRGRLEAMVQTHTRAETLAFLNPKTAPTGIEQAGQRIGSYLLREQLGEGGWGVVFLAEQEKPVRRRVALKVIKAGLDTFNVIARFEAERQALARMEHPNIAKVLEAGATDAGRPYFAMELVRGLRLTDHCDEKKLPVSERIDLFVTICQAVQHAHQKGIIHRDLKPSNILVVDQDGTPLPKIIDFGIAKATEGRLTDYTYTGGGHLIGTPAYMSPEQIAGPSPDVDTRSDIYSLGVILYELLVGRTPFDSKTLQELSWGEMSRIIREKDPLRPTALLATLPQEEQKVVALNRATGAPHLLHLVKGDLDWIVMKCLEKDRARRYESASSLALDLRRHLASEPILARPPSATYRLQRLVIRNKVTVAAGAAVAIALIVGLTAALLGWREAGVERDYAELNLYAADMNLAARALADGNRGHALELLRKHRPGKGEEDLRGWEWRYLWQRCQAGELFTLRGHEGRVLALAFGPNSRTLFTGGWEGMVRIWDLDSRKEIRNHSFDAPILHLAIYPDAKALVIGTRYNVIVSDFEFSSMTMLPGAQCPVALSPDGRTLISGGTNGVIVWDAVGLKKLQVSSERETIPDRNAIAFSPDSSVVAIPVQKDERTDVKIWSTASLKENGFQAQPVSILKRGDKQSEVRMAFLGGAQILATGQLAGDPGLQLWDARTGLPLPGSSSRYVLKLLPLQNDTLLTCNHEQDFSLWETSTQTNITFLRSVAGHENEIWSLALSPDETMIASGSKDGIVKVWNRDTFTKQPISDDSFPSQDIGDIFFPPDQHTFQTISMDSSLGRWKTEPLEQLARSDPAGLFRVVAFSPEGTKIAVVLTNGAVELWRAFQSERRPERIRELLGPSPTVAAPLLAWSGDGKRLATSVDGLSVWNTGSDQIDRKLFLPGNATAIALSPDGAILAIAFDRGVLQAGPIELRDVTTGQELSKCIGHKEEILGLAFSPTDKALASVSLENTVMLWTVPGGRRTAILRSHTKAVFRAAFSPEGRTLVTYGHDALRFSHVKTGRELMVIDAVGSGSNFQGIKFSRNGAFMATALSPRQIQLFRAPPLEEIDAASQR